MERNNRIPITRLNRFYDDQDFGLELDMAKEIIEGDANFRVVLYQIDKVHSNHDIYGESDTREIRFLPPVELAVTAFKIDDPKNEAYNQNGTIRHMDYGNLTFSVLSEQLTRKKVDINYGDIIGFAESETNMKYWEVANDGKITAGNTNTHFGFRGYFRKIECVTIDPNRFNGI